MFMVDLRCQLQDESVMIMPISAPTLTPCTQCTGTWQCLGVTSMMRTSGRWKVLYWDARCVSLLPFFLLFFERANPPRRPRNGPIHKIPYSNSSASTSASLRTMEGRGKCAARAGGEAEVMVVMRRCIGLGLVSYNSN